MLEFVLERMIGRNADPFIGLFWSSLLGSTLLPGSLTPFFIELDRSGDEGYLGLIFASALGGLIGKLTTYAIGYFLSFRVTGTINRIRHTWIALGNYRLTLPLCWIPWIGDLVTLWAGLNRSPVHACILYFLSMWAMSMLYYVAYRMFA